MSELQRLARQPDRCRMRLSQRHRQQQSGPVRGGNANCCINAAATGGFGVLSSNLQTGAQAYAARPGYSLATGLGTVDALHLTIAY